MPVDQVKFLNSVILSQQVLIANGQKMCKDFIDYCYEKENELSTLVDVNGNTLDLCKHLYVDVSY